MEQLKRQTIRKRKATSNITADSSRNKVLCQRVMKSHEISESDEYSSVGTSSSSDSSVSDDSYSGIEVASKKSCATTKDEEKVYTLPHPSSCPDDMTPDVYIQTLLQSLFGFKPKVRPTLDLTSVILEKENGNTSDDTATRCHHYIPMPKDEDFADYDVEVVTATRDNDLEKLRALHNSGRSLFCCNRYGESLLHMACRRGFTSIVKFLLEEANVSIRRTDDCGRTPFHDALWNRECQYFIVEMLMLRDPTFLLTCDKNGHTPFAFARREHWSLWRQFIWDRRDHIRESINKDVINLFR